MIGLTLIAIVGAAQSIMQQATPADPRLQTLAYDAGRIPQLRVASGYALTLALSPEEAVQTVAIGESSGWQVLPSKRGDTLFIKAEPGARPTNLSVVTSARTYSFDLVPVAQPSGDVPYRLQMIYPEVSSPDAANNGQAGRRQRFKIEGAKVLRPASISDDGLKTYIQWKPDQALPGVFTIDDAGRESLLDGNMRGGFYVIDSVPDRLIFRLDRLVARAVRSDPVR